MFILAAPFNENAGVGVFFDTISLKIVSLEDMVSWEELESAGIILSYITIDSEANRLMLVEK